MQQLEDLRERKTGLKAGGPRDSAGPSSNGEGPSRPQPGAKQEGGDAPGKLVLPKRRRVIDVLQDALAVSDGSGDGTDDSDVELGAGLVMDWRAKTV